MSRLHEYAAKDILPKHGVPVPKGIVTSDSSVQLEGLKFPVAVKAQILVGGRGKSGGIRFAESPAEARRVIEGLIGSRIQGVEVRSVLVEEKAEVSKEIYTSVSVDRDHASALVMLSEHGGVDVEEIEAEKIFRVEVNPLIGLQPYMLRRLTDRLSLGGDARNGVAETVRRLYEVFNRYDAQLVEVNPLAVTRDGRLVALDAKMLVDDNALFRQADLKGLDRGLTEFEQKAFELGVNGTEIRGDISTITSGAGCQMATNDTLTALGGRLGPTIDLGPTALRDKDSINAAIFGCVSEVVKLHPKVILFNAFFQFARCDILAEAIKNTVNKGGFDVPIVARLKGRAEDEAQSILSNTLKVFVTKSFDEACRRVVQLAAKVG